MPPTTHPTDPAAMPPWAESNPEAEAAFRAALADADDAAVDIVALVDEPGRWHITSLGEAEWAMAHVAAATDQIAAVDEQRQLWQAKLDEWFRDATREPQRSIEFFEGHLERWGVTQRTDKVKTVKLASGDIATSRPTAPKIVLDDEAAFIDWALATVAVAANGEPLGTTEEGPMTYADLGCVKITYKAMVSVVRDLLDVVERHVETDAGTAPYTEHVVLTVTGEVVDGLGVELPETTAKVKPRPLALGRGGAR